MGVYRDDVKQGMPYRNGVKMNAYRNGVKVFNDGPPPPPPTENYFGLTINSGSDSQFILPLKYGNNTAHHDLTIWWGDGQIDTVTGTAGIIALYQGLTHSYPSTDTEYSLKMTGTTYLQTAENSSYFGFGFYTNTTGYNAATNKSKVVRLLGSPDFLLSSNMSSKNYCYSSMFSGCTSLTEIPATLLPATTLAQSCYSSMFASCSSLQEIPATLLPATTLAQSCYASMFRGCTALTTIPATLLPATTLVSSCYEFMFSGCTSLTTIYMDYNWFIDGKLSQSGMFNACLNIVSNVSWQEIPVAFGGNGLDPYKRFIIGIFISNNDFILPLKYGNNTAHHDLTIDWGDGQIDTVTGTAGITAQYEGLTHTYPASNTKYTITITGSTYLETAENGSYFGFGFYENTTGYNAATNKSKLTSLQGSPDFLLSSSMSSKNYCYSFMFYSCTALTTIPSNFLPSFLVYPNCYTYMFYSCTSLSSSVALRSTILADACYSYMFARCSSLSTLLSVSGQVLAQNCYNCMFSSCTSLQDGQGVSGNILSFILPSGCLSYLFSGCTNLRYASFAVGFFSTHSPSQVGMFRSCTQLIAPVSYANIPSGWK
jgi:hypothetical protein